MKISSWTKFHKSTLPSIILFFLPAQAVVMALVDEDQQMVVVLSVEVEVVEDTKKNLPLLSFARPDLGFLKMDLSIILSVHRKFLFPPHTLSPAASAEMTTAARAAPRTSNLMMNLLLHVCW